MPANYLLDKSANDQYYFNLTAENNEKILTSETYMTKSGAETGIESVRKNSPYDDNYERKISADDKHFFVLKAENNKVIGKSETYSSVSAMENGISSVKRVGPNAPVIDRS